jgi:UDP-3-O-[3-hydroxymyristoyl] glucosamine N-acyltransferase
MGGQSGIAGHLTIASGVRLAARSGIMNDVDTRMDMAGNPAQLAKAFFKELALIRRWTKAGQPPPGPAKPGGNANPDSD